MQLQLSSVFSLLALMAVAVQANPGRRVTPTPPKPPPTSTCIALATTTQLVPHACPDICFVEGSDSSLCPIVNCPLIPESCSSGSTFSTQYVELPTTVISSTTAGCTVTVEAETGCLPCGCSLPGCPICVKNS